MSVNFKVQFEKQFGLDEKQCDKVMRYMRIYYRMEDVIEVINDDLEDKQWFEEMSEAEKKEFVRHVATMAEDDIEYDWRSAIIDAIENFSYRMGIGAYKRSDKNEN